MNPLSESRVAVVTGAASGIGAAVTDSLAYLGCTVLALDNHWPGGSNGGFINGRVRAYTCDVSSRTAVARVLGQTAGQHQEEVSLLVNVAGILRVSKASSVSQEDWRACMGVNAEGIVNTCRALVPRMKRERRGSIVNVLSNAATTPRVDFAASCASKAAALMYTRCLGLELAPFGIRCNSVSPGSTDTPMQRAICPTDEQRRNVVEGSLDAFRLGIPLGRVAEPSAVAEAVLFLLSEQSRHVTMHDLVVDGGATLGV